MNLIQFLYLVVAYYTSGNKPINGDGERIIDKLLDTSFPVSIPYLGDVITAMKKGSDVDYVALSDALTIFRKEYVANPAAKLSFAKVVGAFATWFKNSSDSAFRFLSKESSLCEDLYIRNLVKPESIDQAAVRSKLAKVTKTLGFKGKTILDADESKTAKATDPEAYKDYLALRRQHNLSWKASLSEFVRSSGGLTVPYKDAAKYLAKKGIEHSMPKGFTGRIDAEGNWYTNESKIITGVPAASMFPEVVMNSTGQGDWIFQAVRVDGTMANYFYSKETKDANSNGKFEFTSVFIKKLPSYRKKWLANLKGNFDYSSISQISSVVIELLYLSSQRVGTKIGGNESSSGFGMSTILCKMVTIGKDGSVLISYKGKDGVPFKFRLTPGSFPDKVICKVLAHLVEGKSPRDPVFTRELKNGTHSQIAPTSITAYFKSITGGANIHKLRTAAGTALFQAEITKYYAKYGTRKLKPAQVMELLKKAATLVGRKLGHVTRDATGALTVSPGTSLKNYIDPSLQVELFQHFGCPVPTYLEKMLQTDNTITSTNQTDEMMPPANGNGNGNGNSVDVKTDSSLDPDSKENTDSEDVSTRLIEEYLNGDNAE